MPVIRLGKVFYFYFEFYFYFVLLAIFTFTPYFYFRFCKFLLILFTLYFKFFPKILLLITFTSSNGRYFFLEVLAPGNNKSQVFCYFLKCGHLIIGCHRRWASIASLYNKAGIFVCLCVCLCDAYRNLN